MARPAGEMPEVGREAVLWTGEEPFDPVVAAELLHPAVSDTELRVTGRIVAFTKRALHG